MLAGAVGTRVAGEAAAGCAGLKEKCKQNNDCCKGLQCNNNGKCKYKNNCGGKKGDYCEKNKDCCDGFRCRNKTCKRCNTRDQQCNQNKDCCPGFNCKQGKCQS
jgi:hypothetical protein